jgi:hypothetical protein
MVANWYSKPVLTAGFLLLSHIGLW